MELTEKEIKNIAIEFTRNTLSNECPKQMCFTISYPLSIHLKNKGIKNLIKRGFRGIIDHYWIKLDYENGFIIDATARQFDSKLAKVHFGEELATEGGYDSKNTYDLWSDFLINNRIEGTTPDIEMYIKIGIKASIILLKDNNLDDSNMKYLDCICQVSKKFYNEDLSKLPNFDNVEIFRQFCINKNPL